MIINSPTPWTEAAGIRRGDDVGGTVDGSVNGASRRVRGTVLGAEGLVTGLVRVRRADGGEIQILRMTPVRGEDHSQTRRR
jgi:hypothetical protein